MWSPAASVLPSYTTAKLFSPGTTCSIAAFAELLTGMVFDVQLIWYRRRKSSRADDVGVARVSVAFIYFHGMLI